MGKALAEAYPEARAAFEEADAAFGVWEHAGPRTALSSLCFEGPEDQLTLTEITQPAILATSIAACRVLTARGLTPAFVAGHSLGEYSANVAAGTLAFADAVAVVRRRGRYMQEAVPVGQGAMAAILGADADTVRRACEEAAQGEVVAPGQHQRAGPDRHRRRRRGGAAGVGAGQGAGRTAGRAAARERAVPLRADAAGRGAAAARAAGAGRRRSAGAGRRQRRRRAEARPPPPPSTRWCARCRRRCNGTAVIRRLASEGVSTYVEVGPGAVLSGLVRKIHAGAHVLQFGSPADLEAVMAACST